jgi:hypothetical protein
MNYSVFSASANPAVDRPLYHKPWSYVRNLLDTGVAVPVEMFQKRGPVQLRRAEPSAAMIQDMNIAEAVETLSRRGGLLPFSHVQNPLCKPESPSYPIPAVGARTRTLHCQAALFYREARMEFRAATA